MNNSKHAAHDRPIARFPPYKFIGAVIILVPTVALTFAVAAVIPAEDTPRVSKLDDGATSVLFTSMREVILPPVGVVFVIVFSVIASRVVGPKLNCERPTGPVSRMVGRGVTVVLIGMAVVVLCVTIVPMYWQVRNVIVYPNETVVESLLRSWRVPRGDITRVQLLREDIERKGKTSVGVRLTIEQRGGIWYSTKQWDLEKNDPALPRYVKCATELEKQLIER